ncbi:hypothetical protein FZW96_08110 [Bacillus sp. BGMRC 2118]|nr:hypothetical protein FZW96_08110 [Bacillus sp. BGMRC 2118]
MKKLFYLILIFLILLAGCSKKSTTDEASETATDTQIPEFLLNDLVRINSEIYQFMFWVSYGANDISPVVPDSPTLYNYSGETESLLTSLKDVTEELTNTKASKPYKQAHKDLLTAYQDYQKTIQSFKSKLDDDKVEISDIEKVIADYTLITKASEKWFAVYKKEQKLSKTDLEALPSIGNSHEGKMYIEYTHQIIKRMLENIDTNVMVPYKNDKEETILHLDKTLGDYRVYNPKVTEDSKEVSFLKLTKAPKDFVKKHTQLLEATETFINLINHPDGEMNEQFMDQFISYYEETKKAQIEWKETAEKFGPINWLDQK